MGEFTGFNQPFEQYFGRNGVLERRWGKQGQIRDGGEGKQILEVEERGLEGVRCKLMAERFVRQYLGLLGEEDEVSFGVQSFHGRMEGRDGIMFPIFDKELFGSF